jgi:hypothetical protein
MRKEKWQRYERGEFKSANHAFRQAGIFTVLGMYMYVSHEMQLRGEQQSRRIVIC